MPPAAEPAVPGATPIRVFVAYTGEDADHAAWVVQLASRLTQAGFNVRLDKWHKTNRRSWPQFMSQEIKQADRILTVLTPAYRRRVEEQDAGGAPYEFRIVTSLMLQGERHRLAHVVRSGSLRIRDENCAVPMDFVDGNIIDFHDDAAFEEHFAELERELRGLPALDAPPIAPSGREPIPSGPVVPALGISQTPANPAPPEVQVIVQTALVGQLAELTSAISSGVLADLERMRRRWQEGRHGEVLDWLRSVGDADTHIQLLSPDAAARVLRFRASVLLERGEAIPEAEALVKRAHILDPGGDERRLRAVIAWRQGGPQAALAILAEGGPSANQNLRASALLQAGLTNDAYAALSDDAAYAEPAGRSEHDVRVGRVDRLRLRALVHIARGEISEARHAVDEALQSGPDWPSVRYLAGAVAYLEAIAPPAQLKIIPAWPEPIDPGLVRRDADARAAFDRAAREFASLLANEPAAEERRLLEGWQLAALAGLIDEPDRAIAYARELLAHDPAHPYAIVWAAHRAWPIDLERPLDALRASLRATSAPSDVISFVNSALLLGRGKDAAAALDAAEPAFRSDAFRTAWMYWRAHVALYLDDATRAEALMERLPPPAREAFLTARLRLQAVRTGDAGPLLAHLDAAYAGTQDARFLYEAAYARAASGIWAPIAEHASELEERVGTLDARRLAATALIHTRRFAQAADVVTRALEGILPESSARRGLYRLRAASREATGDVVAAIRDLEAAVTSDPETRDLLALAEMYQTIGNAPRVAALARAALDRADVSGTTALRLANATASDDRELARALWRRSVASPLPDEAIGAALVLGVRLGLDAETAGLTERMAELAAAGRGGVRAIRLEDLLRTAPQHQAEQATLATRYARGELPVHIVAHALGWSLVLLYHAALEAPGDGGIPPDRFALRIRHGGRGEVAENVALTAGRVAVDATSLILAHHVGLLPHVEAELAPVILPHGIMAVLQREREDIAPIQPSALTTHRAVLDGERRGTILRREGIPPELTQEEQAAAGPWAEWLALLTLARQTPNAYILDFAPDPGIRGARPFELAGLGRMARLVTPRALVDALARDGELTPAAHAQLLTRLGRSGDPAASGLATAHPPPKGATIYALEGALDVLTEAGVLNLATGHFRMTVEPRDQSHREAALAAAVRAEALGQWVDELIHRVSTGLEQGLYRLLPASEAAGELALPPAAQALADLVDGEPAVDAIWIDDRFVNRLTVLRERRVVDVFDVMAFLTKRGRITADEHQDIVTHLQAGNARYVPVAPADIHALIARAPVGENRLVETRALAAMRSSLAAALADRASLQLPAAPPAPGADNGEIPYLLNVVRGGGGTILLIWQNARTGAADDDAADRIAEKRCRWILDAVYLDIGLSRAAVLRPDAPPDPGVAAVGLAVLLGNGMTLLDDEIGTPGTPHDTWARRYVTWAWNAIVEPRLDLDPSLRPLLVERVIGYMTTTPAENAGTSGTAEPHETTLIRRSLAGRFFDILPEPLQQDLARDPALLEFAGRVVGTSYGDGTHDFQRDAFAAAVARAIDGEATVLTDQRGTQVRIEPAAAPVVFQLRAPDTGLALIGDPALRVLSSDSATRAQAVLGSRLLLDLGAADARALVERIEALPGAADRLDLFQERMSESLITRYGRLAQRLRETQQLSFDDLTPPDPEMVRKHFRLGEGWRTDTANPAWWEGAATALVADAGLLEAYRRLAEVPVPLPRAVIEHLQSASTADRRAFVRTIVRSAWSPVGLAHMVRLLLELDPAEPQYGRLARRIVRHVAGAEWRTDMRLLRQLLTHAFDAWEETTAPETRGGDAGGLLAAWYHASRLTEIFIAGGADRAALAVLLDHRVTVSWVPTFRRDPAAWFDAAHPRHLRPDRFALATLAYAYASYDGARPGVWTPALGDLMFDRLSKTLGEERLPDPELHFPVNALDNTLGSFVSYDRLDRAALPMQALMPMLAGIPDPMRTAAECIKALSEDPTNTAAWLTLHVCTDDLPLDHDLEEALFDTLRAIDLPAIVAQLGIYATLPITVCGERFGRHGTATDQVRVREQLARIAQGSGPAEPPAVRAAVLDAAIHLARGENDLGDAVRSFRATAMQLGRANARWWPAIRTRAESFVAKLPLALAHWLMPLLLAARAGAAGTPQVAQQNAPDPELAQDI